jgi:SHS2 domain-containing protein
VAGFELLEHTADVGVIATGDTFGEALAWLARGMFSVIAEMDSVEPRDSLEVSIQSSDRQSLVVDWLNELLYRFDAEGFLPREIEVAVDEASHSLTARCLGDAADPERHVMLTDVKAATYYDLEIAHNGEWRIQAVLDV